jgi:hypothetical protein
MKYILLSFALLFSCSLFAQKVDRDEKVTVPDEIHGYRGLAGGYYFLPIASLNEHIMYRGASTGFTNAIGVGYDRGWLYTTPELEGRYLTAFLSFHYLLPQEVKSDSASFKLNGYNAQFDLLGWNFIGSDQVTITGGLAWAFGRLKMTEDEAGAVTKFTNPYFAPEARLEFNVRLGDHFHVGVRGAYRHDITKTSWKRSGSASDLPGTRLSGTMAGAFIGWGK